MGQITSSPLNFTSNTDRNDSTITVGGYGTVTENSTALQSLFGKTKFTPFPNKPNENGMATGNLLYKSNTTGNRFTDNNFQDISVTDLVTWSNGGVNGSGTAYKLTFADFAYLKNLGVYPNNRLIIARRYATPVGNDLNALSKEKARPLSTLISWVPPGEDFLKLSFGEKWTDAAGSFTDILNKIGEDLTLSSDNKSGMAGLGAKAAGAFNVVPLPGLTEGLQQQIAINLGLANKSSGPLLPIGDPNLIKEAKRRVTLEKGSPGSGLDAKVEIKMIVEYEQKYIDGIDPTIVYMDIISNILSFGTSNARFMWNQNFSQKSKSLIQNLINGDLNGLYDAIKAIIQAVIGTITELTKSISGALDSIINGTEKQSKESSEDKKNREDSEKVDSANKLKNYLESALRNSLGAILGKYKIAIFGVINALTGSPSGYFHVTVGNPKRPTFSSGDMIVDSVDISFGPVLSWNDLPSTIKAEFTLKNARPLGADELYARFNNTSTRSYERIPDFYQANSNTIRQATDNNGKPVTDSEGNPVYVDYQIDGAYENYEKETAQGKAPVSDQTMFNGGKFGGGGANGTF